MAIDPRSTSAPGSLGPLASDATVDLLNRIKGGDDEALHRLLERCMPALRRWAHGRLPASAVGMPGTADLVRDAAAAALPQIDAFEVRHQGALQAYLRQAVMDRIRDLELQRRPDLPGLPQHLPDDRPSPLEAAIGSDNVARYDAAVHRLKPADREAIIGRIELQYSYEELAIVLDKPTPQAARVAVTQAMKHLAEEMRHA